MSVMLETSVGDIVIDLETTPCPRASTNFIKLCKAYYYNFSTFFSVQTRFLAQGGDPTNSGTGGECIWGTIPYPVGPRYFVPEMPPSLKHRKRGTVSLALIEQPLDPAQPAGPTQLVAGSQFFITLADNIDYLDGKHAVIGHVVEGGEPGGALDKLDSAFVDDQNRPLTDIRIRGVVVLDDPFPDPPGLRVPSRTPSPTPEQLASIRLTEAEAAQADDADLEPEEREARERAKNAKAAALTLEMVGDLPFAEIAPPENILFVCKLNPVTRSEDLELIFSRFGTILTCEVIRDKKSGDSLQYAFIEFAEKESAEQAYFKMQNTLIDDRRIWVDFSQSVSKLHGEWVKKRLQGGGRGGRPVASSSAASASAGGKGVEGGRGDRYHGDERRHYSRGGGSSSSRGYGHGHGHERASTSGRDHRGADSRGPPRRGDRDAHDDDDRRAPTRRYDDRRRDEYHGHARGHGRASSRRDDGDRHYDGDGEGYRRHFGPSRRDDDRDRDRERTRRSEHEREHEHDYAYEGHARGSERERYQDRDRDRHRHRDRESSPARTRTR